MFFWGASSLLPLFIILAGLALFLCAKVLLAVLLFAAAVLAVAARPLVPAVKAAVRGKERLLFGVSALLCFAAGALVFAFNRVIPMAVLWTAAIFSLCGAMTEGLGKNL